MLISEELDVAGSVSGGCIEGSVIEAASGVIESGIPQLLEFGVEDERAWSVGLSCGGQVQVLLESWPAIQNAFGPDKFINLLLSNEPFVLVTEIRNGHAEHHIVRPTEEEGLQDDLSVDLQKDLQKDLRRGALAALSRRTSGSESSTEGLTFFHVHPRKRKLVIVGGAEITVKLLNLASQFSFETYVIDPRSVFTQTSRFETSPDHLFEKWPQQVMSEITLDGDTFGVLLTHDPKIDDPAIMALLRSPAPYIGALGGRKTQEKRKDRLRQAGFGDAQLDRIRGPVGLDIGASDPSEIALSVMAEIVQVQNG